MFDFTCSMKLFNTYGHTALKNNYFILLSFTISDRWDITTTGIILSSYINTLLQQKWNNALLFGSVHPMLIWVVSHVLFDFVVNSFWSLIKLLLSLHSIGEGKLHPRINFTLVFNPIQDGELCNFYKRRN